MSNEKQTKTKFANTTYLVEEGIKQRTITGSFFLLLKYKYHRLEKT
ncbi:hypothetical protein M3221_16910 [Domibacillus indicus]|nr:hypothetical protein [Domibacillus indicus]MCM3790070.1 hypothetical protein [Domibacillus indicus]